MNPLLAGKFAGAFQPGAAGTGFDFETLISNLPKTEQDKLRLERAQSQIRAEETRQSLAPFYQQPYNLDELGRFREQEARRAQELGKESLKEAFKYGMLANIPKTISQSLGNVAALNALAGREITSAFSNTLANYPRAQFSTFNFQPQKYFE
jgi:hypothetical protein